MKILLVEDDPLTRTTLSEILLAHQYTVNTATDGLTTLEMAGSFLYDLILLDIGIPKLNGISVCKQLRSKGYQNPILLLTARDSSTDRVMGLDAGADDYVVKPFDINELMARVRALLRRGKSVSTAVMTWENLSFDPINNEVKSGERLIHLTSKEYCLLELFLLNPKRIFSRRAILDRLWDFAESQGKKLSVPILNVYDKNSKLLAVQTRLKRYMVWAIVYDRQLAHPPPMLPSPKLQPTLVTLDKKSPRLPLGFGKILRTG